MTHILTLEGQEIPLTAEVAASDETLRNALAPFYPEIATASFSREQVDGVTRIRAIKTAGTKGYSVLQALLANEDSLNPALALGWQITQLKTQQNINIETLVGLQPQIDRAIDTGEKWETEVNTTLEKLNRSQPNPSRVSIAGL